MVLWLPYNSWCCSSFKPYSTITPLNSSVECGRCTVTRNLQSKYFPHQPSFQCVLAQMLNCSLNQTQSHAQILHVHILGRIWEQDSSLFSLLLYYFMPVIPASISLQKPGVISYPSGVWQSDRILSSSGCVLVSQPCHPAGRHTYPAPAPVRSQVVKTRASRSLQVCPNHPLFYHGGVTEGAMVRCMTLSYCVSYVLLSGPQVNCVFTGYNGG